MRRRLARPSFFIGCAALAALFLTVVRPSPEGLVRLGIGVGSREVLAAPGQPYSQPEHNLSALQIVNQTLIRVRDRYVSPNRIDPKAMLYAALDSVQYNIPEVLVEPNQSADTVTVHVNSKEQTFSTHGVDSPWRLSKLLKGIFSFMEANMNAGVDLANIEYAAANGILSTLDPHSVLLDPEQAREMDVNTGGAFGGLGIIIGMREKKLTVIRPMPNTPAAKAGIRAKDHIVRIDNEGTENLGLTESVDRMRGKEGTKVTVWIARETHPDLLRFDLVREEIKVASVESKLLAKGVGYIRIKQFAARTAQETKTALKELTKKGASAFVVDLRWNPGGLLGEAIRVSDLFIDRGAIVTTVSGPERETYRADRDKTTTHAPVAVLINENSASASEIVAGALKNLDRGVIIGDTSFGKGSVQILYNNQHDGSKLKLTTSEYLTPGDVSIQGFGITPDIKLHRMYVPKKNDSAKDVVRLLEPTKRFGERDLKATLHSSYAQAGSRPRATLQYVYEADHTTRDEEDESLNDEPLDDEFVEDFEIQLAKEFLLSSGKQSRVASLKNVERSLARQRTKQKKALRQKLQNLGVDWSAPQGALRPSKLSTHFQLDATRGAVTAGSTVKVTGTITNEGPYTVFQAHARAHSTNYLFNDLELVFGRIDPGTSRTWSAHIQVPESAVDRLDYIQFDVADLGHSAVVQGRPVPVTIQAIPRPTFSYSHRLLDEGNGDGLVQAGETHQLLLTVQNTGDGLSKETGAILRNASGKDLTLQKARFELGMMKPGESQTVAFSFTANATAPKDGLFIELQVYDSALREATTEKLQIPLFPPSPGPKPAQGALQSKGVTTIYNGASEKSGSIATVKRGTPLLVTGKLGQWYRVQLDGELPGFVHAGQVRHTQTKNKTPRIKSSMQVTPPALRLTVPSYETHEATYRLRGVATDETKVEDVYIFVSNEEAKIDNKKIFYRSNRDSKDKGELRFDAAIPLWPGSNAVTVVTREGKDVETVRRLYLYRQAGAIAANRSLQ